MSIQKLKKKEIQGNFDKFKQNKPIYLYIMMSLFRKSAQELKNVKKSKFIKMNILAEIFIYFE